MQTGGRWATRMPCREAADGLARRDKVACSDRRFHGLVRGAKTARMLDRDHANPTHRAREHDCAPPRRTHHGPRRRREVNSSVAGAPTLAWGVEFRHNARFRGKRPDEPRGRGRRGDSWRGGEIGDEAATRDEKPLDELHLSRLRLAAGRSWPFSGACAPIASRAHRPRMAALTRDCPEAGGPAAPAPRCSRP